MFKQVFFVGFVQIGVLILGFLCSGLMMIVGNVVGLMVEKVVEFLFLFGMLIIFVVGVFELLKLFYVCDQFVDVLFGGVLMVIVVYLSV